MDQSELLVIAMAEKCKAIIAAGHAPETGMPEPLRLTHLEWMCDNVVSHADNWRAGKLHRWIGFIQCAMIANGLLDLESARAMFNEAKVAYGDAGEDLLDHLNPQNPYEVDIGGEA